MFGLGRVVHGFIAMGNAINNLDVVYPRVLMNADGCCLRVTHWLDADDNVSPQPRFMVVKQVRSRILPQEFPDA